MEDNPSNNSPVRQQREKERCKKGAQNMGVSKNMGGFTPQIIHFSRVFPYFNHASILGGKKKPYFWFNTHMLSVNSIHCAMPHLATEVWKAFNRSPVVLVEIPVLQVPFPVCSLERKVEGGA